MLPNTTETVAEQQAVVLVTSKPVPKMRHKILMQTMRRETASTKHEIGAHVVVVDQYEMDASGSENGGFTALEIGG